MTDHPRFQMADSATDERYREYHSAPQVKLVFQLVDWWLDHKRRRRFGERQAIPSTSERTAVTKQLSF